MIHHAEDQRNAIAIVHLSALQHNLRQVRLFTPKSHILAMIKSNGYGHGIREIAHALSEADGYGVASLNEALLVRAAGSTKPILLMAGFFNEEELTCAQHYNLSTVIHCHEQLACLENLMLPLKVWLKVDTGMSRIGFPPEEIGSIITQLESIPQIQKPFVVMSHFACADDVNHPLNNIQLSKFSKIAKEFPQHEFSLANSAAIISRPESHFDWVRPGLMLYGASPLLNRRGRDHGLIPVMELKARLISKKIIHKNTSVGYGAAWISPETIPVGTIAFGYGDGYPRSAESGTPVWIRGKKCSLIGRVSMDFCTLDLTNCKEAQVGDEVILFGKQPPIEDVAKHANTIAYELMTKVSQRVKLTYR